MARLTSSLCCRCASAQNSYENLNSFTTLTLSPIAAKFISRIFPEAPIAVNRQKCLIDLRCFLKQYSCMRHRVTNSKNPQNFYFLNYFITHFLLYQYPRYLKYQMQLELPKQSYICYSCSATIALFFDPYHKGKFPEKPDSMVVAVIHTNHFLLGALKRLWQLV